MNDQKKIVAGGKEFVGSVLSTKMQKTVIVGVVEVRQHPLYKKLMRKVRRFPAHNDIPGIVVGDNVRIKEVPAISKTKRFRVTEKVVEK